MSAVKVAVVAVAAVGGTLVAVNLIQRYRQKKAIERFEKNVDAMMDELKKAFDVPHNQPWPGFGNM